MVRTQTLLSSLMKKQIFVSSAGQNLQLLLPITYQGNIGYIREELFIYLYREDSECHRALTCMECRKRLDALEDIRLHVLREMPLADEYREKLIAYIREFMVVQRIERLNDESLSQMPAYVEELLRKYVEMSGVSQHLGDRKLYVWGCCSVSDRLKELFDRFGSHAIDGYIDSDSDKVGRDHNGISVYGTEILNRQDMFLLIPLQVHQDIMRRLTAGRFRHKRDFFYFKWELRTFLENGKHVDL